jgi:hypothetical protein
MEARYTAVLAGGLVIAAGLFIFLRDPYLTGIVLVIDAALAMAFQIMGETHDLPDVAAFLSEDAKRILLVNRGNDRALAIHVTLVPLDREFDLPELPKDGRHEVPLPAMVAEAKAMVTYENDKGRKFSRTFRLTATGSDDDLLKPLFPTFGWK